MQDADYIDLQNGEREPLFFFMLNAYLCSRIDIEQESDEDEEVNVYIAHLLHSLVDGTFYTENAEVLADAPYDVFSKVEQSESDRHKLKVYRTNADHRLVAHGLFSGFGNHQGLYRKSTTPQESYLEQAQQYYGWAACFSERLPRHKGLAAALHKLARDFEVYQSVLSHMGTTYFGLMDRLSPGEVFHLEREAHEGAKPALREGALDRMLDAYSLWCSEPKAEHQLRFREACAQYQEYDEAFAGADLFSLQGTRPEDVN